MPMYARANTYADLIAGFRKLGYESTQIREGSEVGSKRLFVRHDVDVSLECAAQLAQLEHELGVAATYFVACQSPLFRIDTPDARNCLKAIVDCGHVVGLHVDRRTIGRGPPSTVEQLAARVPEINTRIVSSHAPASYPPRLPTLSQGWIDANDLLQEAQYLSDSANKWREGDPLNHPATAVGKSVHMNTHPVWWVAAGLTSREMLVEATGLTDVEIGQSIGHWLPRLAFELGGPN